MAEHMRQHVVRLYGADGDVMRQFILYAAAKAVSECRYRDSIIRFIRNRHAGFHSAKQALAINRKLIVRPRKPRAGHGVVILKAGTPQSADFSDRSKIGRDVERESSIAAIQAGIVRKAKLFAAEPHVGVISGKLQPRRRLRG